MKIFKKENDGHTIDLSALKLAIKQVFGFCNHGLELSRQETYVVLRTATDELAAQLGIDQTPVEKHE